MPEDLAPDELTSERASSCSRARRATVRSAPIRRQASRFCARAGRFGPYVQLGEVGGGAKERPQTASLFSFDVARHLTLERRAAAARAAAPASGTIPPPGAEIVASNGRYGPYLKRGNDTRSLDNEEQLFEVTLEEALGALRAAEDSAASAKQRLRCASSAPTR